MSIATASFHSNSWDLPIRRPGLSLLMSGDVPKHLYSEQHSHLQQNQEQHDARQQQQHNHHHHYDHHHAVALMTSPGNDQGANKDLTSPAADHPSSSLSPSGVSPGTAWARRSHSPPGAPGSGVRLPQGDFGAQQHQHSEGQLQDPAILHMFSAMRMSTSATNLAGIHSGGTAEQSYQHQLQQHQQLQLQLQQQQQQQQQQQGREEPTQPQCNLNAAASAAQGRDRVFSTLDAVDGSSPPCSPADAPVPSLFHGARAASFPPYSASRGAAPALCCCCGAGVCAMCRGVSLPLPLRASASHSMPTRQHSQPTALSCLPQGQMPISHNHSHHGATTFTGGNGWFHFAHSLPAQVASLPTSPQQGGVQGGPGDYLAQLGWDTLPAQQGSPQQAQQHGLPGSFQGLQQQHQHQQHSPAPGAGGHLALSGGSAGGPAVVDGAHLESALAMHWGFGMESMESSSLSLSQECSDSLGGGEISSGAGGGGSGGEQEVDFDPTESGEGSQGRSSSTVPTTTSSRGRPPLSSSPGTGGLVPLSQRMSSPSVPRCTSNPQTRTLPRDGGSPVSPAMSRGLSSYFGGKSRSFTSLAEVTCIQSIQELAKPVRNYARRKRIGGKDSPRSAEASRKQALAVGKEPRSLFKKGGSSRQSLGIQAGLAVAVAMGDVDVEVVAKEERYREGNEAGAAAAAAAAAAANQSMETVMEEPAEKLARQ